jgi:hypothetical protein
MATIALRPIEDADSDALFEQARDPESVRMAAFTHEDPDDRAAFDAHPAQGLTGDGQAGRQPSAGPSLVARSVRICT